MSRYPLFALLLAGCSDYNLTSKDDAEEPIPSDTEPQYTESEETETESPTDTEHTEIDDCEVEVPDTGEADVNEDCLAPDDTVADPWDVTTEWTWTNLNAIMTPVIGNLTDDDGDGDVDEDDTPDIAFVGFTSSNISSGSLVLLDGATGNAHWVQSGYTGGGGIALADVDSDGTTDIVAFDTSRRVVAVDASGTKLWTSSSAVSTSYPQATVADVDGDGTVEVIADALVLDGATGSLETSLSITSSIPYRLPAVGDIDQDGIQEVILGNKVFDPTTGAVEWSASMTGTYGHWAALVDYDGDAGGEVAMIGGGQYHLYDDNGSLLVSTTANASQPGAPCVADFDGDGDSEIAWASSNVFSLYELDGTRVWQKTINDSSGLASCSGYDMDGDGTYEILYADQYTFYVLDGATGAENYTNNNHCSGTLWEYPAVADVDNDGSAEVVYTSNDYLCGSGSGVTVLGHNGTGWYKSGPTWHTHDFAVTNINEDGSVPASPTPSWQLYNVYRARPAVDDAATDLTVKITDVCFGGCDDVDLVEVAVQVCNEGGTTSEPYVPVALFAMDSGAETLIDVQTVHDAIEGGRCAEGLVFEMTAADWGEDGIVVKVDDDGYGTGIQTECDESNNEDEEIDSPC